MKIEFEFETPNGAAGVILQQLLRRRRWTAEVGMETITLVPVSGNVSTAGREQEQEQEQEHDQEQE